MSIEYYLTEILTPILLENGVKYRFVTQICNDIRHRMHSLLSCWGDEKTRKTILLLALEEAIFYKPDGKPYVREFVVTTIRNSMLEIAASDSFVKFKMNKILSNEAIVSITSSAILFFNDFDFESHKVSLPDEENVYLSAKHKYPIAWDVLFELANLEDREKELVDSGKTADKIENNYIFSGVKNIKSKAVVLDGYTLEFDEVLCSILKDIKDGNKEEFYTDSFKFISRNFEKVLCVMQKILQCNGKIVTCNYYISRTYIKRKKLLSRPAHTTIEAEEKSKVLYSVPI